MVDWNKDRARDTFSIKHWSGGYFDIDDAGRVIAVPPKGGTGPVVLMDVIDELEAQGLQAPVLIRFIDILHDRLHGLQQAFAGAMRQDDYRGRYTPLYPVKVNQQRRVIEELLSAGNGAAGLEAGSKPELLIVLALSRKGGRIICNGYKDREYIRLALAGRRLGLDVFIVVEKLSELVLIIEEAQAMGVEPLLGVRVRLSSIGKGKWQNSGGEKAKFGLSSSQLLLMLTQLGEAGMLDTLQLLHVHLGSQIANIRDIQAGMREVARYYAELRRLGAPIQCVDAGGGLGIDYEGTRSRNYCSMNYTLQEYAHNVVHTLWEVCNEQDLPHPDILTESGRALTAHHAVLVSNVIDQESRPDRASLPMPDEDQMPVIRDLLQAYRDIADQGGRRRNALEVYHDAVHAMTTVQDMYTHGLLTLEQRALAEQLYFAVCRGVRPKLQVASRVHRDVLDELNEKLADKYFCNISVFQSLPDVWAIDQIFPVMPLHRLDEAPLQRAVIEDITCDSDGRIDAYVDNEGIESTLPLHATRPGEPYYLGFFLVGAYQEILGDMHNLFGDTHSVNVLLDGQGGYQLAGIKQGDSVDRLLSHVDFDAAKLHEALLAQIQSGGLDDSERSELERLFSAGLAGYTYFEI